jgi:hypothetical protein
MEICVEFSSMAKHYLAVCKVFLDHAKRESRFHSLLGNPRIVSPALTLSPTLTVGSKSTGR